MLDSSHGVCVSLTFSRPSKISFFVRIFCRGRGRERERERGGRARHSSCQLTFLEKKEPMFTFPSRGVRRGFRGQNPRAPSISRG